MKSVKKLPICVVLLLPLWLLSGCAVYDSVFHPHRLGTPPMTSSTKARIKAAEKARHKGTSLKAAEAASADGTTDADAAPPAADDAKTLSDKNKSIEDMLGNTYNTKTGLLKRSRLQRMQYDGHKLHHYDTRPLTPREASTENRKLRKKGHTDHGKDAPRSSDKKEKAEPLDPALDTGPDPGPPAATPATPAAPEPKAKATKAVAPQPDPTEPTPEPAPTPKKSKDKKAPKPDPTQPAPGE